MEALRYPSKIDTSREIRVKMFVGPREAHQYLATDINNRKLMKNKVDRYAALMMSGDWTASDAFTICIDWNGHLIDGQHRLHAVIQTGLTVEMVFIFDCDPNLRKYIDTGASRTIAQVIYMNEDDPVFRSKPIQALAKQIHIKIDKLHEDVSPEEMMQIIRRRYYVYKHVYDEYLSPCTKPKAASKHVLLGMLSLDANNIKPDLVVPFYRCLNCNEDAPQGKNGKAVRDYYDWYQSTTKSNLTAHSRAVPDEIYYRLQKAFYLFANNLKTTSKSGELYPLTSAMLDNLNEKYKAEANE